MPKFCRQPHDALHRAALPRPLRGRAGGPASRRRIPVPLRLPEGRARRARCSANGLKQVLHNLPAGDWDAGERGIACLPDRVERIPRGRRPRRSTTPRRSAARRSTAWPACAGRASTRARAPQPLVDNLRFAADELKRGGHPAADRADQHATTSPASSSTAPSRRLPSSTKSARDNLFLQYDIYHAQRMEGELVATLRAAPGAHRAHPACRQPGPQRAGHRRDQLPLPVRGASIAIGYDGWIGCEYKPAAATAAGLGWTAKHLRTLSARTRTHKEQTP